MSSKSESPPFGRGQTAGVTGATDLAEFEGREVWFRDLDYSSQNQRSRTGRLVRCRIVRNTSAGVLLPRRLVSYDTAAGKFGLAVAGYTTTTAAPVAGVVDEFLPAAGVAQYDLFYIVVEGPAECLTDIAAVDSISIGNDLVALTAATSGATTAGRVDLVSFDATSTSLGNQVANRFGKALSAKTSANTNTAILVDLKIR